MKLITKNDCAASEWYIEWMRDKDIDYVSVMNLDESEYVVMDVIKSSGLDWKGWEVQYESPFLLECDTTVTRDSVEVCRKIEEAKPKT